MVLVIVVVTVVFTKTLINIRQAHNYFIVYEVTCFDLFKRSSSDLLTYRVRRPDDDRLKRPKHVASYTIK